MSMPEFFDTSTRAWFRNTLGTPTKVQREAWPKIESGLDTLVSAPTGTGKTLTAFLVFLDRLLREEKAGTLEDRLQVVYISPLKSLAADIRENLKVPLEGIYHEQTEQFRKENDLAGGAIPWKDARKLNHIKVAVRTGDTTSAERQRMAKHPPHILITTPESLYLLLTSKSGRMMLSTAKHVIIDELHAMIDTKRGAHLMLSLARLDHLCGRPLQRIGLSATIEPLDEAARYLSPSGECAIVAPKMKKKVRIEVVHPEEEKIELFRDSVWKRIAASVYDKSRKAKSVIAFVDGRAMAEKLAHYISDLGGEDYARVHHGSLSKEQRHIVEQELKEGSLKLLIATSSMELGIDVGEIDLVLQIGVPRTIAGTMQRLGRAGHRPNQTSVMQIFPRTAEEAVYCGMTAVAARQGGIERMNPPRLCLDILAQHLVSMAAGRDYQVGEVTKILQRAYPFRNVTEQDVKDVLCMLAGDYEHEENIPVRPRILYDRIHETVSGDSYTRMLAVSAGGTIPDRGMYAVRSSSGVKIGEVEEEFVFESRVGERFQLGSFHWRIQKITKDTVEVIPADAGASKLPFWKGDMKPRNYRTGITFGKMFGELNQAYESGTLKDELQAMGLDEGCVQDASEYIMRQIAATQVLPSDDRIIIEHYRDETGNHQMMIHSVFGSQINGPLALLLQEHVHRVTGRTINYVSDDDGFLLFPYDGKRLPAGMLGQLCADTAKEILEILLPATPLFNIVFRYNAGHALMMGARKFQRQPLWIQRTKSAQMLDSLIQYENHPLIRETKRECMEDYWDLNGVVEVLKKIQSGQIQVRELFLEMPSPMSFILRNKTEASLMYDYTPTPPGIVRVTENRMEDRKDLIVPAKEQLQKAEERRKLPDDEEQLHTLLMIEGDLTAGELEIPVEWLDHLARQDRALYVEPGVWIAAEQAELYEKALVEQDEEAQKRIVLRLLRYRGSHSVKELVNRYLWKESKASDILKQLYAEEKTVLYQDRYYHKELFDRARVETVKSRRMEMKTQPFASYAAWMLGQLNTPGTPMEQLEEAVSRLCGQPYVKESWESLLLPARVHGYRSELLDRLLSQGEYYWRYQDDGLISLERSDQIDWDQELVLPDFEYTQREQAILNMLKKRGACFISALAQAVDGDTPFTEMSHLASLGLIRADSFEPVRYDLNRAKIERMVLKQQIRARAKLLSAGRWDFVRPQKEQSLEEQVEQALMDTGILCRETAKGRVSWSQALEVLRIWEFTGKVRRGYFVDGLSGIQFIHQELFEVLTGALNTPNSECIWVNAADPIQPWGKLVPHMEGRNFTNVPGTYAAIAAGRVVGVMERKGKVFRCFEEEYLPEMLKGFAAGYQRGQIYSDVKRIVLKEYPESAQESLKACGFKKEILDFVLYRQ